MHSSGFKKNTRFPATISLAATWNRQLAHDVGVAMGEEVRALGRHVLLAPGINIDRTPLNGRTFEYYSEDPYLTKELAIPLVKGVQSQRITACLKHYAANNQETDRRSSSSEVDERTLHEIYLRAFRATVKEANPWAVMTAYNMINGVFGCEHKYLIRETLMNKWDFDGIVMTDWFASRGKNKTTENCIQAGLTLEMPWPSKYKYSSLQRGISEGRFTEELIDDLVRRNLRVMMRTGLFDSPDNLPKGSRNTEQHQLLARRVAEEGMVLLKNEKNALPLNISNIKRLSEHGPNLMKKFGGFLSGGSSAVNPPYEITPAQGIASKCKGRVRIFPFDSLADVAIVFAGLDHSRGKDSESRDRETLHLDEKQVEKIKWVASNHLRTIVCLIAGSPIAMDEWIDDVEAVLMCWYGGMEAGHAIANVLFGDVNPSGKLPITFPKRLEDSPAHSSGDPRNYPGDDEKRVYYDEGVFVGYRWFDEKNIEPLFPFGFGLSYTTFQLSNIQMDKSTIANINDSLSISIDVTNNGLISGAEVVQVYAHDIQSSVKRPPRELVGFEKIYLQPSESKTVSIKIRGDDLAFYDSSTHDWILESGSIKLLIGNSSRAILFEAEIMVNT